VGRLNR